MSEMIMAEPPVSLAVAVELIPMSSRAALYQYLSLHKDPRFPPLYKHIGQWKCIRMITQAQIRDIQERTILRSSRYTRRPPGPGRPRSRSRDTAEKPFTFTTLFPPKKATV